jgi:hypothetical protein
MDKMIAANRLKPFKLHPRLEAGDPELIAAAQDAGLALTMMRKEAGMELGELADALGMATDELEMAERGQLVERSHDGRLIDFSAALLVRVARLTKQKAIPLP